MEMLKCIKNDLVNFYKLELRIYYICITCLTYFKMSLVEKGPLSLVLRGLCRRVPNRH